MEKIVLLLIMMLVSCGVRSQQRNVSKVTKDTLLFYFDRDYIKSSTFNADAYVRSEDYNQTQGVSFKIKKLYSILNTGEILDLKEFSQRIGDFKTAGRDKSNNGKLFERLNNNVVIFVDKCSGQFMEMSVALYYLD